MGSENGKTIYFSLTNALPAGGQIVFDNSDGFWSQIAGQTVSTYSNAESLVRGSVQDRTHHGGRYVSYPFGTAWQYGGY